MSVCTAAPQLACSFTKPCSSCLLVPWTGLASTWLLARSRAPTTGCLPTVPRPALSFLLVARPAPDVDLVDLHRAREQACGAREAGAQAGAQVGVGC